MIGDNHEGAPRQLPRDPFLPRVSDAVRIRNKLVRNYEPHPNHDELERDWRSELVYFLLPDRFNSHRPPTWPNLTPDQKQYGARWDFWAISGRNRFQGGTIRGVTDKLPYLNDLGVTAIWVGPVWKQRVAGLDRNVGPMAGIENDTWPEGLTAPLARDHDEAWRVLGSSDYYHGYSIQNFLEVDPRFGTTADLRELVDEAHNLKMRVILDIVINHSSENWTYNASPLDPLRPPYLNDPWSDSTYVTRPQFGNRYPFGAFLNQQNLSMSVAELPEAGRDDAVWPYEFQNPDVYHRRGFGDYGKPERGRDHDEPRDADWMNRDFAYGSDQDVDERHGNVFELMVKIWTYWMAATDCDGFRVDTMKHVPVWVAHEFTREVRTFARSRLKKRDFLVVGEVGGADDQAAREYLTPPKDHRPEPVLRLLEVDRRRAELRQVAIGGPNAPTAEYVLMPRLPDAGVAPSVIRDRVMTSIDDHDNLGIPCERFARQHADSLLGAVALLLFGPGIPCLYYGTEQALSGPDQSASPYITAENFGVSADHIRAADRYLRETLFAPLNPRKAGIDGLLDGVDGLDPMLPGFAPRRPQGAARFDQTGSYRQVQRLAQLRKSYEQLSTGDIEVSAVAKPGDPLRLDPGAPVVAWTRCLHDARGAVRVALIVVSTDTQPRTVDVQLPPVCAPLQELRLLGGLGRRRVLKVRRGLQTDQSTVNVGAVQPHEVLVFAGVISAR